MVQETEFNNKVLVSHSIIDDSTVFNVHNKPVMIYAANVLSLLGKTNKAILRAKGNSIPNAVAVANIITEKLLKGKSKVQTISVDSEGVDKIGKMLSTIEIVLLKSQN